MSSRFVIPFICTLLVAAGCASTSGDKQVAPKHFETKEAAVAAMVAACRADDTDALRQIFGSQYEEIYATSDVAADTLARQAVVASCAQKVRYDPVGEDMIEIVIGDQEWPLAIPLIHHDAGWVFDTAAGAEEILNRRIGHNELRIIALCRATHEAQQAYRNHDLDGDQIGDYATRYHANPGLTDGLYWEPDEERGESPLEAFMAEDQDYYDVYEQAKAAEDEDLSWHGYHVRLLRSQGAHAPGGALEFTVNGRMTEGWALVFWPADHGASGIMTFQVSHHGKVFQKDLGPGTEIAIASVTVFDPAESWTEVVGDGAPGNPTK